MSEAAAGGAQGDPGALYRLMAWLSPAYPIGAFSYSSGIEWAVEAGDIADAKSLQSWITSILAHGAARCDAVLFVHAYRAAAAADVTTLEEVNALALALAPSRERYLETTAQGRAFLDTTRASWPAPALIAPEGAIALPVAVGICCAAHGVAVAPALQAYLHAMVANLISAGVRLVPLGQTDGQRVLAALEEAVGKAADNALAAGLDDIGSAAFRADLASMHHETQYTRLFRS